MGKCYMCEKKDREGYWCYYCSDCRKIKHYLNIYGERVYEILDNVLSRTEEKQQYKINDEIKKDIENKEYSLRSNKKKKVAKLND